jgi:hypothetical protein
LAHKLLLVMPDIMPPRPEKLAAQLDRAKHLAQEHGIFDWQRHNPPLGKLIDQASEHLASKELV